MREEKVKDVSNGDDQVAGRANRKRSSWGVVRTG